MSNLLKAGLSCLISVWVSFVFLTSLFYKFDDSALEPQHIFTTIGNWMNDIFGTTIGGLFADYGAYLIGGAELLTSLVLLAPIVLWKYRAKFHFFGGLMASLVMGGAIFFHLFTPLGWNPAWTVVDEATCQATFLAPDLCTDTELANAALSILILGFVMAFINKNTVNAGK
jgi:hypothetical protein